MVFISYRNLNLDYKACYCANIRWTHLNKKWRPQKRSSWKAGWKWALAIGDSFNGKIASMSSMPK